MQALTAAYRKNPELDAQRASLRATDEEVPRAISGFRPRLNFSVDQAGQSNRTRPSAFSGGRTAPGGYQFSLNQTLFRGFRIVRAVDEAEANVRAGRADLTRVEQSVLLSAVTAYMNVVRDQAIVRLREGNVRVLSKNLKATQERFSVGEVTKTDVAQSRARRARAVSDLDVARANLKSSRANYERVVGHKPRRVFAPGVPYKAIPKSLGASRSIAEKNNPAVIAALYREQAARHNVDKVFGELLPRVELDASYSDRWNTSRNIKRSKTALARTTLTVPLYQGGEVRARVRQAKHLHVQRIQQIEQARLESRESAIRAWSQLNASRGQVRSDKIQVDANQIALNGVRLEEKVGQRTLLDVLDAEQELLDSQVRHVTTQRDLVVNAYSLISALGRLTAVDLGLGSVVYDPEAHYHEVRRKWFDISITDRREEDVRVYSIKDAPPAVRRH